MKEEKLWVDYFNYLGKSSGGSRHVVPLDPEEMSETAKLTTGLDDFGESDWKNNYYIRIERANRRADMTTLARFIMRNNTLLQLRNRLLAIDKLKRTPEIRDEVIEKPIFIMGNPRTGTSILFELLLQDRSFRAPLSWEALCPVEFPEGDALSRMEIARSMAHILSATRPGLNAIHKFGWEEPAECYELMEIDFFNLSYQTNLEYEDWLKATNAISNYRWHKIVLQLLQHGDNRRQWLLKCPTHLHFMDELFETYPDARVIYTHRDSAKSLPSYLSLNRSMLASQSEQPSYGQFEGICSTMENSIRKLINHREKGKVPAEKIIDIHYLDLMSDPVNTIRKIYAHFNLGYGADLPDRIRTHLLARPKNLYGEHRYSAEEFGLTERGIRARFKFYTDYYGIKLEL